MYVSTITGEVSCIPAANAVSVVPGHIRWPLQRPRESHSVELAIVDLAVRWGGGLRSSRSGFRQHVPGHTPHAKGSGPGSGLGARSDDAGRRCGPLSRSRFDDGPGGDDAPGRCSIPGRGRSGAGTWPLDRPIGSGATSARRTGQGRPDQPRPSRRAGSP